MDTASSIVNQDQEEKIIISDDCIICKIILKDNTTVMGSCNISDNSSLSQDQMIAIAKRKAYDNLSKLPQDYIYANNRETDLHDSIDNKTEFSSYITSISSDDNELINANNDISIIGGSDNLIYNLDEKLIDYEKIAKICNQVIKVYSHSVGDKSKLDWEYQKRSKQNNIINIVRKIIDHNMTMEDIHEEWMTEKITNGWKYGDVKDPITKLHPYILNYSELPLNRKIKDNLIVAICECFK